MSGAPKFFKNGKVRVIAVIAGVVIVLVGGTIGIYKYRQSEELQSVVDIHTAPNVDTLPGVGNQPIEYVRAQQEENAKNAAKAYQTGSSNIPTLVQPSFLGTLINPTDTKSKTCKTPMPSMAACEPGALLQARAAGVKADELKCKGCQCIALKTAGYNASELKQAGFDAAALRKCGYSAAQLRDAGFSAKDLKDAGFSARELKDAGFSAGELKAAGFSAKELKDAGFTAQQLKDAGFTAKELKDAGFTAQQLRDAGFNANDLKAAGFDDAALAAAGYLPAEVAALKQKKIDNCDVAELKRARAAGMSALEIRQQYNCGLAALKAAGFNAKDLKDAGFSAKELKDAGFSAKELKDAGFSAKDLKDAGFTAGQLRDAGFSAKELKDAGFTAGQLRDAGFSADDLRNAGFSPDELRQTGFTKGDLIRAGFTPEQAGYENRVVLGGGNSPVAVNPARPTQAVNDNAVGGAAINAGLNENNGAQIPSLVSGSLDDRLARIQRLQEQQLAAQQADQSQQQQQALMAQQASSLLTQWSSTSPQQYQQVAEQKPAAGEGAGANAGSNQVNGTTYKAGTILFAVLDTGIDTDVIGSPVMAHIVGGPLKGSKLLGQFTRVDTQVRVVFNTISVPSLNNSLSLNAYAIDQNTARTAVTGDVNNHYMLRYGSLFAASFLSGLGSAVQSGTTFVMPGITWTTHDKLNTSQQVAVALGNVGQQYSAQVQKNFDRPPTVKIAGGTGIGVLLMADMLVPNAQ